MQLLMIGGSHAISVVRAAAAEGGHIPLVPVSDSGAKLVRSPGGGLVLSPAFKEEIAAVRSTGMRLVSAIGGNTHSGLALLRFPRSYDFVLSDAPEIPLDPGAEIVPEDALFASLSIWAAGHLALIRQLALELGLSVHVESPPPNGDDEYCTRYMDTAFREDVVTRGLAPRLLRYKIWRLHSRMVAATCEEAGVRFLRAPVESMDEEGFLVPACYSNATHANNYYGKLVLRQLQEVERGASLPECAGLP